MSDITKNLSDSTFEEFIGTSDIPVLVDFWAEWCGPCKQIAPILEEVAVEQDKRIVIAKLNIDENLGTTRRFEVMSIPTLILFKGGKPIHRLVGAKPKEVILQEIRVTFNRENRINLQNQIFLSSVHLC